MKINFNQKLCDKNGPIKIKLDDGTVGPEIDLRFVCVEALHGGRQDERLTAQEHIKRYQLGLKIQAGQDECYLSIDEISLIQSLLPTRFPASVVVGQACLMLEGDEEK